LSARRHSATSGKYPRKTRSHAELKYLPQPRKWRNVSEGIFEEKLCLGKFGISWEGQSSECWRKAANREIGGPGRTLAQTLGVWGGKYYVNHAFGMGVVIGRWSIPFLQLA
jgi:hypothetical protein